MGSSRVSSQGSDAILCEFWQGAGPTLSQGFVRFGQQFVVHTRSIDERLAPLGQGEPLKVTYSTGAIAFTRGVPYAVVSLGESNHGELGSGWGGAAFLTLQGPDGRQNTIAARDLSAFRLID